MGRLGMRATRALSKLIAVVSLFVLVLLIERYIFSDEMRSGHRLFDSLRSGTEGHPNLFRWLVLGISIPAVLWIVGVFDRGKR